MKAEPAMFGKSHEGATESTESKLVTGTAQRVHFRRILAVKLPSIVAEPEAVVTRLVTRPSEATN
jgi:hypothetical protein